MQCPKCKGKSGYYEKRVMYYEQYIEFDGTPDAYYETAHSGGKIKYCSDCGKDITNFVNALHNQD